MKCPTTVLLMAITCSPFFLAGTANAAPETMPVPSQLNPKLPPKVKAALDQAFERIQNASRAGGFSLFSISSTQLKPLSAQMKPAYFTDPYTHKTVDANQVARQIIEIEKIYFNRTGRQLGPNTVVTLDDLSGRAAGRAEVPASRPSISNVTVAEPKTPNATCASSTQVSDPASEMTAQWAKIQGFRTASKADICSLAFGNLVQQAASASPIPPIFSQSKFAFGNPASAQGVFTVTPAFGAQASGFQVSLKTGFDVTFLNRPPLSIIEGTASVVVPTEKNAQIATEIDLGGAAFPNKQTYKATNNLGKSSITYSGDPKKDINWTLWSHTQSWNIPLPVGSTSVSASLAIEGNANLKYDLEADSAGFYTTVGPSLKASLVGRASAVGVVCDCHFEGAITVQDSDSSTISALLADIPYNNADYAVERLFASYSPPTYQATAHVYGHLAIAIYFDQYIMRSKPEPLGNGFSYDSGWVVKPFPRLTGVSSPSVHR